MLFCYYVLKQLLCLNYIAKLHILFDICKQQTKYLLAFNIVL